MNRNLKTLLLLLLIAMGLAVYWDPQPHEFITFDDDVYITDNDRVRKGLGWDGFVWAVSSPEKMYWHPVTWLSHMIDAELYGLHAGGHHFNSLLLHIANGVLLFLALHRMTGAAWRSFFVATLFLVHPLGVESVAWASERKNVLAGFFWMLTLLSYIRYTERPGLIRYLVILVPFALGLMAKPILVTLPFLFLILDFWPLKRMAGSGGQCPMSYGLLTLGLEKIPFLVLSGASAVVSSLVAQTNGTWVSYGLVPFLLRVENALVSYPAYIRKTFWPSGLAPFYPYPQEVSSWETLAAVLFLVGVSALAFHQVRKRPYGLVGWLWFLGTLVPVSGLVQQGLWPRIADRFAYVPLIGLFMIIVWGCADLARTWRVRRISLTLMGAAAVLSLGVVTWHQNVLWRNSIVLFEHTLKVTERNFPAHMNLGIALASAGRGEEALRQFQQALDTGHPKPQEVHYNLGQAYASMARYTEAVNHFETASSLDPQYVDPHIGLGTMFLRLRQWDRAQKEWSRALELNPNNKKALNNIGVVMLHKGETENAILWFHAALEVDPDYLMAKKNLDTAIEKRARKASQ